MSTNTHQESRQHSSWEVWIAGLVAIASFGFGAIGQWQYDARYNPPVDKASVIYHTLQLFILHAPHLEHAAPWPLHVGRLAAAGLFLMAAGTAFSKVFRDELRLIRLRMPWRRGHVIVCGLGDLGLRLALGGRKENKFVVAIERNPAPAAVERARAGGVLVLHGDARDPAVLNRGRVGQADLLVAACETDDANVAIAATAGGIAKRTATRRGPLVCRLLIHDHALRATLNQEGLFPNTGANYRVNLSDLDLAQSAARQALREHPLDFAPIPMDSDTLVHLVVIGFGQIGQSLALQAARIGHFANEIGPRQKRLRITVVADEHAGWDGFLTRYPVLRETLPRQGTDAPLASPPSLESEICDLDELMMADPRGHGFIEVMAGLLPKEGALVTYAICLEGANQTNLRLGLELYKQTGKKAQVLIYQTSRKGFAALFAREGKGVELGGGLIHAFGMKEDVYNWDVLLRGSEDRLASAINEVYRNAYGGKSWEDLSEGFRESNRQAADHIPIKLRALGWKTAPLNEPGERIEQFSEPQRKSLAELEHVRWCAERFLDGWRYGPQDDRPRKINHCLVPWDKLTDEEKRKDHVHINAIPEILRDVAGQGIYRP